MSALIDLLHIYYVYMVAKITCHPLGSTYIGLMLCIPSKETQLESGQVGPATGNLHCSAVSSFHENVTANKIESEFESQMFLTTP